MIQPVEQLNQAKEQQATKQLQQAKKQLQPMQDQFKLLYDQIRDLIFEFNIMMLNVVRSLKLLSEDDYVPESSNFHWI